MFRKAAHCDADPVSSLRLTPEPEGVRYWLHEIARHNEVLIMLTKKDFNTRYKRASLGILWAVAVPAVQASIMAIVFSRVVRSGSGPSFPVYVLGGILAYSYFSSTLPVASQAIVDGANLTDKVWFPRALLVLVPCLSNLVGLVITLLALLTVMPVFGVSYSINLIWLIPAIITLVAFTTMLSVITSALYVYFRDVKYILQATLLVWLYVTPVVYPQHLLGRFAGVLDANPLTGIVTMVHMATVGAQGNWNISATVSLLTTVALAVVGTWIHSRLDRLFVDQL